MHDHKLLVIVKICKTWRRYLYNSKSKVFILTNNNLLCLIVDTKSFSS